jgi:DNA primase
LQEFELKKRQILDRIGILDVASEHVTLKRAGRRWIGLCPFHAEKTPSFTVSPDLGIFKCFGCGRGGDVFSFVQLKENVPFTEAMRMLADRAGIQLTTAVGPSSGPSRAELAKVNNWAMRFFHRNLTDEGTGQKALAYLRDRGFSDAVIERFGLGLATDRDPTLASAAKRAGIEPSLLLAADLARRSGDGRLYDTFRNRLMFPIRDATTRVIGFGGRTLVDDRAKYINTAQNALFDKGRNLYGVDLARKAMGDAGRAVVVEGYTDCMAAHQAGVTETVATLGTALTESQIELMRRYCDKLVLLFDSDEAGKAAADRAIGLTLPRCVTVTMARIPDGKDPSEFISRQGSDAFSDVLNHAIDALEFMWRQTLARFEGGSSDAGRREAILEFMRVVSEAAGSRAVDAIQRGELANRVASLLGIDGADVHQLMARLQSRQRPTPAKGQADQAKPRHSTPVDAEQAAWVHLLEVALNQPGLLSAVQTPLDAGRVVDDTDRRIAEVMWRLSREMQTFSVPDVLARCHGPGDAERVSELAERGARRGNFEETFRNALEGIQRTSRSRFAPPRLVRRTVRANEVVSADRAGRDVTLEQP